MTRTARRYKPRGRYGPRQTENIYIPFIDWGGRHRKDMDDLDALAASIGAVGLLQPIVVTDDKRFISDPKCCYRLVAGERRLRAMVASDYVYIRAYVVGIEDATALLTAEGDENACRKPFTPSEAVGIGQALEELERAKAQERQAQAAGRPRGRKKAGPVSGGNLPPQTRGKTRDEVAEAVGMSGRTYEKAKVVVEAVASDPATFGDLPAAMDQGGKVHRAFQEVKRRRKRQELEARAAAAPADDTGQVVHGDSVAIGKAGAARGRP